MEANAFKIILFCGEIAIVKRERERRTSRILLKCQATRTSSIANK
jgi:hypothetical protein